MKIKQTALKKLAFLGAAICEGQLKKGVAKGPKLIRQSGLFSLIKKRYEGEVVDYGDISILEEEKTMYEPVPYAVRNLHVLGPLLGRLHSKIVQIAEKQTQEVILTVGGDHSIGSASISAMLKVHKNLKVVWVDAHADCTNSQMRHPDKLNSQNYHGMPLSHVTGMAEIPKLPYWSWLTDFPRLDPKNVVLIGIRDIDTDQYITLKKYGVKCFTMDHVTKLGIGEVMTQTINYLDPDNQHPFHLSFDVDGVDPSIVSQTGTMFRYGLSGMDSVHIVRRLAHERKLVSMDLVEINEDISQQPIRPGYRGEEQLKPLTGSVGMGVDLVTSLFQRYFEL